jgi:hypothetical protein
LIYNVCFKRLLTTTRTSFDPIITNKHNFYIFLLLKSSQLIMIILLKSILTRSVYYSIVFYLFNSRVSLNFWGFLIVKASVSNWISNTRIVSDYFRIQKLIRILVWVSQFFINIAMSSSSLWFLSVSYILYNASYISVWLRHSGNPWHASKINNLIRHFTVVVCQKISMTSWTYII